MDRPDAEVSRERERSRRERGHFEAVAEEDEHLYWADRTEAGRRRQQIRARRLREAAQVEAPMRVLDLGCGTGAYTRPFALGTTAGVVALDVAPALLQRLRDGAPPNVEAAAADASELPFAAESFDAVIGNAVLHHLPLDKALPELLRVLKPAGRFCFAEPNLLNPQVFLERNVPFLRRWLENSPDEVAFVRWSLVDDLERHGLVEVRVEPFDFLYPLTPSPLIGAVEAMGAALERVPLVREVAGSLLIEARKPRAS